MLGAPGFAWLECLGIGARTEQVLRRLAKDGGGPGAVGAGWKARARAQRGHEDSAGAGGPDASGRGARKTGQRREERGGSSSSLAMWAWELRERGKQGCGREREGRDRVRGRGEIERRVVGAAVHEGKRGSEWVSCEGS